MVVTTCWEMSGNGLTAGFVLTLVFRPIPIKDIPLFILTIVIEFYGEGVGQLVPGRCAQAFVIGMSPTSGSYLWDFAVRCRHTAMRTICLRRIKSHVTLALLIPVFYDFFYS